MVLSILRDDGSAASTDLDEVTVKDDTIDLLAACLKVLKCNGGKINRTDLWEGYLVGYPSDNDG